MTAKEYLSQAFRLDKRINSKLAVLSSLKDMAIRTTSLISDEVVSHTRNVNRLQDIIAKIVDAENEVNESIDLLVELKREITSLIGSVANPSCQILLEHRYLCYHSWEEIAVELNMNIRSIYRLHGEALQEVDRILQHEKKFEI